MFRFSYEISKAVVANIDVRAEYLWTLFSEHSGNTETTDYCDIGIGLGYNTLVFGQKADRIVAIDVKFGKEAMARTRRKAHLIVADARSLPIRAEVFNVTSLFSVVEHAKNVELTIREALRILKPKGYLLVQIPNKFFPVDLHTGLPFVFFLPAKLRSRIVRSMGYPWLADIDIPNLDRLIKAVLKGNARSEIDVRKIIYPDSVVWPRLLTFYRIARKTHFLDLVPMGYFLIVHKPD